MTTATNQPSESTNLSDLPPPPMGSEFFNPPPPKKSKKGWYIAGAAVLGLLVVPPLVTDNAEPARTTTPNVSTAQEGTTKPLSTTTRSTQRTTPRDTDPVTPAEMEFLDWGLFVSETITLDFEIGTVAAEIAGATGDTSYLRESASMFRETVAVARQSKPSTSGLRPALREVNTNFDAILRLHGRIANELDDCADYDIDACYKVVDLIGDSGELATETGHMLGSIARRLGG